MIGNITTCGQVAVLQSPGRIPQKSVTEKKESPRKCNKKLLTHGTCSKPKKCVFSSGGWLNTKQIE